MDTTIKKNTKNKKRTVLKVNYEKQARNLIDQIAAGEKGWAKVFRELIHNAVDVGARNILIKFEGHSIIIIDNGKGFNLSGVQSALSFSESSKSNKDFDTAGVNGTGLKSVLTFNPDIEKIEVSIQSVSKEMPGMTEFSFNFKHVVELYKNPHMYTEDYYTTHALLSREWLKTENETGTIIRIDNINKNRVKGPEVLINELASFLTPPCAERVSVWFQGKWWPLQPIEHIGDHYQCEIKGDILGKVSFDLYIGASAENLQICGPVNQIQSFADFAATLNKSTLAKIPKSIYSVAGYIYIEKIKQWRMDNGVLDNKFYSSGASQELLDLLEIVGGEVSKRQEAIKKSKSILKQQEYLRKIAHANSERHGFDPKKFQTKQQDSYLGGKVNESQKQKKEWKAQVPVSLRLNIGVQATIGLPDDFIQGITEGKVKWVSEDISILKIIGPSVGNSIVVDPIKTGDTNLVLTHGNFLGGMHTMRIKVMDEVGQVSYIKGPSEIFPDSISAFTLVSKNKEFSDQSKFVWSMKWVGRVARGTNIVERTMQSVKIQVLPDAAIGEFVLEVKVDKLVVAKKKVSVMNSSGDIPHILKIADKMYQLITGFTFNALAHVVPNFSKEESIPVIEYNPNVPFAENKRSNPYDKILTALATAAIMRQVADEKMDYTTGLQKIEEYVMAEKAFMFGAKKTDADTDEESEE